MPHTRNLLRYGKLKFNECQHLPPTTACVHCIHRHPDIFSNIPATKDLLQHIQRLFYKLYSEHNFRISYSGCPRTAKTVLLVQDTKDYEMPLERVRRTLDHFGMQSQVKLWTSRMRVYHADVSEDVR